MTACFAKRLNFNVIVYCKIVPKRNKMLYFQDVMFYNII